MSGGDLSAELSRVAAYDWFGSLACQPLGYVLVGPIAGAIGRHDALWIAAGGVVAMTVVSLSTRSVRELEAVYRS
jgi:hypothetical protein